MPAENDLLVRIIGDASDLQAKFEVAQTQVATTAAAMADSVAAANSEVAASTTEASNAFAGFGAKGVAAINSVTESFERAMAPAVEANTVIAEATTEAAAVVGRSAFSIRAYLANIGESFVQGAVLAKESTVEMRESMVKAGETAMESKTAMGGLMAGGMSLGGLATAAIAITAITEAVNHTAEATMELKHMHETTGLTIRQLAGLRLTVQELGGDFDQVANTIPRMLRAQEKSEEGAKAQQVAYGLLGISMEEIRGKSPEEVLNRISKGMQETHDTTATTTAGFALLSRGGMAMIPVMKELGDGFTAYIDKQGEKTKVDDAAADAAAKWLKDEADLKNFFTSQLIPVMEQAGNVIWGIVGAMDALALAAHGMIDAVHTPIASLWATLMPVGKALQDMKTGNWGNLGNDAAAASKAFSDRWHESLDSLENHAARVRKEFNIDQPLDHNMMPPEAGGGHTAGIPTPKKVHEPKDHAAFDYQGQAAKVIADDLKNEEKETEASVEKLTATWKAGYEADKHENEKNLAEKLRNSQTFSSNETVNAKLQLAHLAALTSATETYTQKLEAMDAQSQHNANLGAIQQKITGVQSAADTGHLDKGKELQQLQQLHLQMDVENDRYLKEEAAKFAQDPIKKKQIDDQIAANHRKSLEQQQHDTDAILKHMQAKYQQVFGLIGTNFKTALNGVLQGTQTMGQAFSKMFLAIELGLAEMIVNWLAKKAAMWAMDEILQLTGMAKKHAAQAVDNTATITGDAAVAAAGAMAYYSAVDPPMAPAMATLAFAETMSWASLGAFEMGGVVAGGVGQAVPIIAHAGERVLSRPQTERFEQMVSGASEGGAKTVNLHYNGQVNAFDRTGMRNTLKSHATDVVDIIREALKDGRLAR